MVGNVFLLWPHVILYRCFCPPKGHYSPKIEPFFDDNINNFKLLSRPDPEYLIFKMRPQSFWLLDHIDLHKTTYMADLIINIDKAIFTNYTYPHRFGS
jgi:hypothetical protein